jgi:lipocalin
VYLVGVEELVGNPNLERYLGVWYFL